MALDQSVLSELADALKSSDGIEASFLRRRTQGVPHTSVLCRGALGGELMDGLEGDGDALTPAHSYAVVPHFHYGVSGDEVCRHRADHGRGDCAGER